MIFCAQSRLFREKQMKRAAMAALFYAQIFAYSMFLLAIFYIILYNKYTILL